MPGFRVDESRQRQIDGLEHLVGVLDQGGGVREAGVLEDGEAAREEQGGNGDEKRPSPGL